MEHAVTRLSYVLRSLWSRITGGEQSHEADGLQQRGHGRACVSSFWVSILLHPYENVKPFLFLNQPVREGLLDPICNVFISLISKHICPDVVSLCTKCIENNNKCLRHFPSSHPRLSFVSVWTRSWRGPARRTRATRYICCSVLTKTADWNVTWQ